MKKTYEEFVNWINEINFCGTAVFGEIEHTVLKKMYATIYEEGYYDGYEQRGIDDEHEDED